MRNIEPYKYYNLSSDYNELFNLVEKGLLMAVVIKDETKGYSTPFFRLANILSTDGVINCGTLGISYFTLYAFEIEQFNTKQEAFEYYCNFYDLKWIKQ